MAAQWPVHGRDVHAEMRQQHLRIDQAVEALEAARRLEKPKCVIEEILFELVDATVEHFCAEEVVMKGAEFPGFGIHSHLHAALLDHLIRVVYDYHSGLITLTDEIISNFRGSFHVHVETQDRTFAKFLLDAANDAVELAAD